MQWVKADPLREPLEQNLFFKNFAKRYIAGETAREAIAVSKNLVADDYLVALAYLAKNAYSPEAAEANKKVYLDLLNQIDSANLNQKVEVSIRPSQLGNKETASSHIYAIVTQAKQLAIPLTIEVDDGDDPQWIFDLTKTMHAEYPGCGFTLLSELRESVNQAKELTSEAVKVRLTRGTYKTPEWQGFQKTIDIDRSFVKCLRILLEGSAKVTVATHDSRLIEIAGFIAADIKRDAGTVEYQITSGMPTRNHERLLNFDERVRVYLPFGPDWYPYLMRRIAHAPESLFQAVKSYL
jgi:proline dehydrogenase